MNTLNLETLKLDIGNHKSFEEGGCIMEMVSYMANEPWSDHPKCACQILTNYAIALNDRFNDEHRQRLIEFIPLLINTKTTDEIAIKRKQLIMWRNVTATYPLILDLYKMNELADKLRSFSNTVEDMNTAAVLLKENKEKIYAYANANAYAYANANAYAYADADANADTSAYAYANANAYAYADADADANAYAYAYAAAKKMREDLVNVAIETLRMAIAIK